MTDFGRFIFRPGKRNAGLTADGWIAAMFVLAGLGICFVALAALSFFIPAESAPSALPTIVEPSATPDAGRTSGEILTSSTPSLTPTPSPAPTEPPPTPTRFYIVPAQAPAVPTPLLPPAAPFPESCAGPGRMNILVMGVDGFSTNYYRPARADTIIMVGINFADKSAQMVSFPRDLWVTMPGLAQVGEARLNTAYHYGEYYQAPGGGPGETKAVMADTFGLRVDRYVVVNFSAFEQGIDAIGGIDLYLPEPLRDEKYPLRDGSGTIVVEFPAGWVHLDGANALIYARIRHDSSDFKRMRRQQQVLFAIRDRLLQPETLPHLPALAQILLGAVRTDLTPEDIALLGCIGPQIQTDSISAAVIDNKMIQATRLEDGAQVLLPRLELIVPLLENFNSGE